MQNLQKIEVNKFHSKLIHKNKMIIFNWNNEIKSLMEIASGCTNQIVNIDIPTKITNLKILDCGYDSLDNLPSNIEILQIGGFIHYPLLNLPVNLKKLIIHNKNQ